ncbi:glycosyltransferase, partial [Kitasatospora sp. NPDC018614]|uniref:glycosyltransferase n=1 Tax=Kitasatospora sp. NPDC018614 TaxID=3364026 RepID=UPI00379A0909
IAEAEAKAMADAQAAARAGRLANPPAAGGAGARSAPTVLSVGQETTAPAVQPRTPAKSWQEERGEQAQQTAQKHAEAMERWLAQKRQDPQVQQQAQERAEAARKAAEKLAEQQAKAAATRQERAAAERELFDRTRERVAEEQARAARRQAEAAAAEEARWQEFLQDLRDKSGGNSGSIGEISLADARTRITRRADAALRAPMRAYAGPPDFEAIDRYLAPHLAAAETEAWYELAGELGINVDTLVDHRLMPPSPLGPLPVAGGTAPRAMSVEMSDEMSDESPVSKTGPVGDKGKGRVVADEAPDDEEELEYLEVPEQGESWSQYEARKAREAAELAAAVELSRRLQQPTDESGGAGPSVPAGAGGRTKRGLTAEAVAKLLQVPTQSVDDITPAAPGAGSGPAQMPAVPQQDLPFTAQELIDELMREKPARPVSSKPVAKLEEWLGPDLFGDRVVPAAPPFLEGYNYRELHSASRVAFFRALDLASETEPTAEQITPASLVADENSVIEAGSKLSLSDTVLLKPGTMRRKSGLPFAKLVRIPKLVHSIWLGRPLSADDEHTGPFMANVAESAGGFGQGFTHVIWTDVTRERIKEAKEAEGKGQDTEELATVRAMVAWARDHKIVLVNVDEVFSAEAPMDLEAAYKMETAKGVGQGYASASDILRLEILQRFGGIYTDGDNELLVDPTDAVQRIADSGQGFAVAVVGHGGMANAVLIAPARHEAVQRHLEVLRGNYLRSSWENSIRGGYFRLLDKNVYSTTDFRKADKEATKPPAVVQNHTDEGDKNAVLHLSGTGPAIWADLARGLGLDSP